MSDNLSHEQQEDWEQWIDWSNTQDWDSVGLSLDRDDAPSVSRCLAGQAASTSMSIPFVPANLDLTLSITTPDSDVVVDPANLTAEPSEANAGSTKHKRRDHALQCTISGCTYQGTFPRQWELQRHVHVKHNNGVKNFSCPVKGCFKGQTAPSFVRSDKLTDHIRGHQTDATADCPARGCTTSLPLDLLIVHINLKHRDEEHKGVTNASSRQKCIDWRCSTKVSPGKMLDHLETHSTAELECMQSDLLESGYLVTLPFDTSQSPIIRIVCPICSEPIASHEGFEKHLFGSHLADQEKIRRLSGVIDIGYIMSRVGKGYLFKKIGKENVRWNKRNGKCPGCEEIFWEEYHYCNLLRQDSIPEVKPHRQLLLRLCPRIAEIYFWRGDDLKNPFFDDL